MCRIVALGATDGSSPGVVKKKVQQVGAERPASQAATEEARAKPQKWLHGLDLDPNNLSMDAEGSTVSPWSEKARTPDEEAAPGSAAVPGAPAKPGADMARWEGDIEDKEERRRWFKKFGINPREMQQTADKINKEMAPKEKKEKHKSLYKVSEKEKKRRKTGGDGHLSFAAKERMGSNRGG